MAKKHSHSPSSWQSYLDLLRVHFIPAWILLFTAGYMVASRFYEGGSLLTLLKVLGIGMFGFEAGMVLNDLIDRELDQHDRESHLTHYYRLFKTRPLAQKLIPSSHAVWIIILFILFTVSLSATLPFPHSLYVIALMTCCYLLEVFYQLKKRHQEFPWSQLIGRIDFALFPVAGYLTLGYPDKNALLYFLYFYPLALSHLALNDYLDYNNDQARQLHTIPVLYGLNFTRKWIAVFAFLHFLTGTLFVLSVYPSAFLGFVFSFLIIALAVVYAITHRQPIKAIKSLALFHGAMAIQALSLIL